MNPIIANGLTISTSKHSLRTLSFYQATFNSFHQILINETSRKRRRIELYELFFSFSTWVSFSLGFEQEQEILHYQWNEKECYIIVLKVIMCCDAANIGKQQPWNEQRRREDYEHEKSLKSRGRYFILLFHKHFLQSLCFRNIKKIKQAQIFLSFGSFAESFATKNEYSKILERIVHSLRANDLAGLKPTIWLAGKGRRTEKDAKECLDI